MKNKGLKTALPFIMAMMIFLGMYIGFNLRNDRFGNLFYKNDHADPLKEVEYLIANKYVDKINTQSLEDSGIYHMLTLLDPHSEYLTPAEVKSFNEDISGLFKGIGITFFVHQDSAIVTGIVEKGPAEKSGLQIGDKLLIINNNIPLTGKKFTADSIQSILAATPSDQITLQILRSGTKKTVTLTKANVALPSLDAAYMLNQNTGYIRLNKFSETTYKEFMFALETLQKKGLKKLILDLRDNGGGVLQQAVEIADEFLSDSKLIVYTEGYRSNRKDYTCKRDGIFEKGPLAVLVNENTASASEVLAGALQDWERATIIGRRTFGKGLVQQEFNLSNGAALKLTTERYYTPLGRNIQKPYDANSRNVYFDEIEKRKKENTTGRYTFINTGKSVKTASGKILYSGGGIRPDIFIPADSTLYSPAATQFYTQNLATLYSLNYYLKHRPLIVQYKNPELFAGQYQLPQNVWNDIQTFAQSNGVFLQTISNTAQADIQTQIKARIARYQWGAEGYFIVSNLHDPFITNALNLFAKH